MAAGRDALGPELAWQMCGEVDHDAVRVDVARAAAFVDLAGGIDGLELDAHACSVMKVAGSAGRWLTWPVHEIAPRCLWLLCFLSLGFVSGTCYFEPNVCSWEPWWQFCLCRGVKDEHRNLLSPQF